MYYTLKKENCLVHTLWGPPNGRWFHTPYVIQHLKAPGGVRGQSWSLNSDSKPKKPRNSDSDLQSGMRFCKRQYLSSHVTKDRSPAQRASPQQSGRAFGDAHQDTFGQELQEGNLGPPGFYEAFRERLLCS